MPGRITYLSPFPLLAALLAVALAAGDADAHRLNAQAFVLPNHQIQIESWFSTGDAAKGASVQVFGAHGQLLTEGQLNPQGIFVFPYREPERLKVVISAGEGHRKELTLFTGALTPPVSASENAPVPLAERDSGFPIKDVLIGIGFLLALAAFALSLRNAQKLRTLERSHQGSHADGTRLGDKVTG